MPEPDELAEREERAILAAELSRVADLGVEVAQGIAEALDLMPDGAPQARKGA